MTATQLYHSWNEKLRHMRVGENKARLRTFAWMMVGMMMSQSVHLSHIARKIPECGPADEHREKVEPLVAEWSVARARMV